MLVVEAELAVEMVVEEAKEIRISPSQPSPTKPVLTPG